MTDTPARDDVERLAGEARGQRLLLAALDICASGRQVASKHLCGEARDQIRTLSARLTEAEREKDKQLSEILALDAAGEYSDCGDTLRALSAALERAERERDAIVAAAYEDAAREVDAEWRKHVGLNCTHVCAIIRALTPDDAREALEKVRRDERERCAKVAEECVDRGVETQSWDDGIDAWTAAQIIAAAIRGDDDA